MSVSIKEKEAVTSLIEKILVSALLLAMGVLFCVGISAAVSITIGVILCVYGIANIAVIGVARRPIFSIMGVLNGALIAIGVAFCTHDLSTIIVLLMPFIIEVVGALMIIDAFICFFSLKQGGILRFLLVFFGGAAMFSLGLCILYIHDFRMGYAELIFGIMLCVAATIIFTFTIIGRVKAKKEKQAKADQSPEQPPQEQEEQTAE